MLVDCVTYVVCSSTGLDVGGESIPYVAGWGEDGALDAIRAGRMSRRTLSGEDAGAARGSRRRRAAYPNSRTVIRVERSLACRLATRRTRLTPRP